MVNVSPTWRSYQFLGFGQRYFVNWIIYLSGYRLFDIYFDSTSIRVDFNCDILVWEKLSFL